MKICALILLLAPSFCIDRLIEANNVVLGFILCGHPDENGACRNQAPTNRRHRIGRCIASPFPRFHGVCTFTIQTLHCIGEAGGQYCLPGGEVENVRHVLESFLPSPPKNNCSNSLFIVLADPLHRSNTPFFRQARLSRCAWCTARPYLSCRVQPRMFACSFQ